MASALAVFGKALAFGAVVITGSVITPPMGKVPRAATSPAFKNSIASAPLPLPAGIVSAELPDVTLGAPSADELAAADAVMRKAAEAEARAVAAREEQWRANLIPATREEAKLSAYGPFDAEALSASVFSVQPHKGELRYGGDTIRLAFDQETDTYSFGPMRLKHDLVDTIVRASYLANVDPRILMAIADKESSFRVAAKASTSSATGLFQFIDATWLLAVRDFGAKYGLESEAAAVTYVDGQIGVEDDAERARILALRSDPFLSTLFAAVMLKREQEKLEATIGRAITEAEVYLVHFLGPNGAQKFLSALEEKPAQSAASVLPAAARANKPIFFAAVRKKKSRSLSVAQVHGKIEDALERRLMRYRELDFGSTNPLARNGEGALQGWRL